MKPPKPTEGVARHCWGKRRRIAKKTEKRLWKAMDRLGLLSAGRAETSETCSWEDGIRRVRTPCICGWNGPSYGCDDWSEYPVAIIAHNHLDAPTWIGYDYDAMDGKSPEPIAKSDRHALKLLRAEIRSHKAQPTTSTGEG